MVRTLTATDPLPTTSVRRPRPPSAVCGPFALTSPAIVWVSRRTGLPVTTSTSPRDGADRVALPGAEVGLDPDVAARRAGVEPVEARRPDLEVAGHGPPDQGDRRRGLDDRVARHRLQLHRPADTASRRSPDVDAQRLAPPIPTASTSPLSVRNESAAVRGMSMSRSGERRRMDHERSEADAALAVADPDDAGRGLDADLAVQRAAVAGPDDDAVAVDPAEPHVARAPGDVHGPPGRAGARGWRRWRDGVRHRTFLPSARMASAASSALSSWRARRSRMSRRPAWISSAVAVGRGAGPRRPDGSGLVAGPEPEGAHKRLDAGADRRVADPELPLHVAEVAAAAQEALEDLRLLAGEAGEPPDPELALDGGPAVAAAQPRDGELARADGTGGDDVVRQRS